MTRMIATLVCITLFVTTPLRAGGHLSFEIMSGAEFQSTYDLGGGAELILVPIKGGELATPIIMTDGDFGPHIGDAQSYKVAKLTEADMQGLTLEDLESQDKIGPSLGPIGRQIDQGFILIGRLKIGTKLGFLIFPN